MTVTINLTKIFPPNNITYWVVCSSISRGAVLLSSRLFAISVTDFFARSSSSFRSEISTFLLVPYLKDPMSPRGLLGSFPGIMYHLKLTRFWSYLVIFNATVYFLYHIYSLAVFLQWILCTCFSTWLPCMARATRWLWPIVAFRRLTSHPAHPWRPSQSRSPFSEVALFISSSKVSNTTFTNIQTPAVNKVIDLSSCALLFKLSKHQIYLNTVFFCKIFIDFAQRGSGTKNDVTSLFGP